MDVATAAHIQPPTTTTAAPARRRTEVDVGVSASPAVNGRVKLTMLLSMRSEPLSVSARKNTQPTQISTNVAGRLRKSRSGTRIALRYQRVTPTVLPHKRCPHRSAP